MMLRMPNPSIYEDPRELGQIRRELEDKPIDYLEGMIEAYNSVRATLGLKKFLLGLNPLSKRTVSDATRLRIAKEVYQTKTREHVLSS